VPDEGNQPENEQEQRWSKSSVNEHAPSEDPDDHQKSPLVELHLVGQHVHKRDRARKLRHQHGRKYELCSILLCKSPPQEGEVTANDTTVTSGSFLPKDSLRSYELLSARGDATAARNAAIAGTTNASTATSNDATTIFAKASRRNTDSRASEAIRNEAANAFASSI
jgi:carbonic anhydrase